MKRRGINWITSQKLILLLILSGYSIKKLVQKIKSLKGINLNNRG
jgi:hypothetical protein